MKTKISRLLTALLALILMMRLSGGPRAIYDASSGYSVATPSATQKTDPYSQYYTMNKGPAPSAHIKQFHSLDINPVLYIQETAHY
jgi:hypothetical protein